MICEKCKTQLSYGTKFCQGCGEKIPKDAYSDEYSDTIWAKFDKIKDRYDTFFLKKLTGNIYFKIVWLILVLCYFFFSMYGNLTGIRFKDSDDYKVQYYEANDEYYIRPYKENSSLELFVPIGTQTIVFTAFSDGEAADQKEFTKQEYKENGYTVTSNKYDYINIDAVKDGKTKDSVKIIVKN